MDIERPVKSPSQERRYIENEKFREQWKCCSGTSNKHAIKYAVQVTLGAAVVVFSMIQIIRGVENQEIYFSMVSGTIATFLPAPQLHKADDE